MTTTDLKLTSRSSHTFKEFPHFLPNKNWIFFNVFVFVLPALVVVIFIKCGIDIHRSIAEVPKIGKRKGMDTLCFSRS